MRRAVAAALAFLTAGSATAAIPTDCTMAAADRAWLEGALDTWRKAEVEWLKLAPQPLPTVAAIDAQCTYLLPAGRFDGAQAAPHGETVTLPDGAEAPIGPISFASGEGGYFAISLPSVWRAAGVDSEVGLERMMAGVLLHEMMHVRQTSLATSALAGAASAVGVSDDELTDDIVQERFADDPNYVAAYTEERDALFAAAAAADDARGAAAGRPRAWADARTPRALVHRRSGFVRRARRRIPDDGGHWAVAHLPPSPVAGWRRAVAG